MATDHKVVWVHVDSGNHVLDPSMERETFKGASGAV